MPTGAGRAAVLLLVFHEGRVEPLLQTGHGSWMAVSGITRRVSQVDPGRGRPSRCHLVSSNQISAAVGTLVFCLGLQEPATGDAHRREIAGRVTHHVITIGLRRRSSRRRRLCLRASMIGVKVFFSDPVVSCQSPCLHPGSCATGWRSSIKLPEGSLRTIWDPPGPVTMSLRNSTPRRRGGG